MRLKISLYNGSLLFDGQADHRNRHLMIQLKYVTVPALLLLHPHNRSIRHLSGHQIGTLTYRLQAIPLVVISPIPMLIFGRLSTTRKHTARVPSSFSIATFTCSSALTQKYKSTDLSLWLLACVSSNGLVQCPRYYGQCSLVQLRQ
jgi:hypothetical protein